MTADFPDKLQFLFEPSRYKVAYGGRGSAKSWSFARALLIRGVQGPLRWLCAREIQNSIADSVHQLLEEQIKALELQRFYSIQKTTIKGPNGTEFIFAGLQNMASLKSAESLDGVWVEEAQTVRKSSWEVLIPTIRKEGSEIWVSFNPELETDDTYKRFVLNPPPGARVVKVNWSDNPWFPKVLRQEMEHLKATDPDAYEHVWEGMCRQVVEGGVYRTELLAADKESRICRVPWVPEKPVDTFWDLGFGDMVSIWFAQSIGFEFRFIDYLQGSHQGMQFYLKELQAKPYIYGTHHLPWDGGTASLQTGRSIKDQMMSAGYRVWVARQMKVHEGIAAVRAIFPRCWFDSEKCADGIQALRHYRYEINDKLATPNKEPLHDWASHPADALRTAGMMIQEPEIKRKEEDPWASVGSFGGAGWMA